MRSNKPRSLSEDINNFLLIKILIFYIAGIIAGHFAGIKESHALASAAIFAAMLAYITISRRIKTDHRINFLNGATFAGLWISAGAFFAAYHQAERPSLIDLNDNIKYAVVASPPEEKPKTYKATLEIQNTRRDRLIAYFAKDSAAAPPQYGDLIGFNSEARYITNSGNPLEFNYEEYTQRQGIYCQAYIKASDYTVIKQGYRKGIRQWGAATRQKLIEIYRKSGIKGKELAVLEALTLGYKNDLDNDTVLSFQTSGAMHILAVSGLHTGIIMLITSMILSFMNGTPKTRAIKGAIIIAILWAFAAITGFSSSVCRSALMFSLMSLAQMLNRPSSTYNTLAASAFILLLIDPMLIFNVGFGLSYLAVLSIISCTPIITGDGGDKKQKDGNMAKAALNTALKYFGGIVIVSLAAQIGTGVLSVKTFRLFPVYFLLANIAVIPLSYVIMISAIAMLALSMASAEAAGWMAQVLEIFLKALTSTVSWIESLPGSSISNIYITGAAAILLYAAIIFLVLWLRYHKPAYIKTSLCMACAFAAANASAGYFRNISNQVIVYNKNHSALYSVVNKAAGGMRVYETFGQQPSNGAGPEESCAAFFGAEALERIRLDSAASLRDMCFEVRGKRFLIINSKASARFLAKAGIEADALIISGNTFVEAGKVSECFGAGEVIFDSSNSQGFARKREKELEATGIKTHYVCRDGAYIYGDGAGVLGWF